MDFVMRKSVFGENLGIKWGGARLAELDFADDFALLSHTHGALQGLTNNLHEKGEKVRLRISREKTKAQTVTQDQNLPPIIVGEQVIEYVENFTYLGGNISNTGDAEKDVQTRIGKAAGVSGRLVRAIITPQTYCIATFKRATRGYVCCIKCVDGQNTHTHTEAWRCDLRCTRH